MSKNSTAAPRISPTRSARKIAALEAVVISRRNYEAFGVSPREHLRLIREGALPHTCVGQLKLVEASDFLEALRMRSGVCRSEAEKEAVTIESVRRSLGVALRK
ncbi:MAG: hypothetical protein H6716_26415 [Polyangiaceae bacterium]|nr:hypothetical protein [Polyangiaceae bacterium]